MPQSKCVLPLPERPKARTFSRASTKAPSSNVRAWRATHLRRQPFHVESSQVLLHWQVRFPQPALDPVHASHLTLPLRKFAEVLLVTEGLLDRPPGQVLESLTKRGQMELSKALHQPLFHLRRRYHPTPPCAGTTHRNSTNSSIPPGHP